MLERRLTHRLVDCLWLIMSNVATDAYALWLIWLQGSLSLLLVPP